MSSEASTVVNRTWDQQNIEDKAPKKDSFEILQDIEWYDLYKENEAESVMPCFARIKYDGKLDATNPIFGVYNVTLGGRIYANDSDASPMALPEQTLQIEFTQPESDLSNVYEEKDVPEDKAAEVIYLEDKFRFKALDVWPAHTGAEKFAWLRVKGGYKLYGESGAEDRWFWNFGLEYPTALVTEGEVLFFWLKYADDALSEDLTGAVACKIETGNNLKTAVSQWTGEVDMYSESADVLGKKWYKQNKLGKMSVPDYYALFYKEDIFSTQTSPRTTGDYSVQQCEVEIKLPEGANPDTVTYQMATGIRFYANNDATTFYSTPEVAYDWYNEEMSFSTELNEEPVYEDKQPTKAVEESFDFDVTSLFGDAIAAYEQAKAAEEAAAADAAAADADASGADSSSSNMVTMSDKQEAATYSANQSLEGGFATYEQLVASDYWYFSMSLDMTEGLLSDDQVLYQWATLIDQAADSPDAPFTIACKRTFGDDATAVMDYFAQDSTELEALYPESALVTGVVWTAQAPDLRYEDSDVLWVGTASDGTGAAEHAPAVSASSIDGNKKYTCSLAKELAKIGRNPADFEKTYAVKMGARIYADDSATTFTTIPMSETTYFLDQPPSYAVAAEGAYALFVSSIAALAVLFMAF